MNKYVIIYCRTVWLMHTAEAYLGESFHLMSLSDGPAG
jgi:hypothetical protein